MMRPISGQRLLPSSQKTFKQDFILALRRALDRCNTLLNRYADPDGTISRLRHSGLKRAIGSEIEALFVGGLTHAAFDTDGVTALAPFPELLNLQLVTVVSGVIYAHRDWLEKHIPSDVFDWLQHQSHRPLLIQEAQNPYIRRDGESDDDFLMRMADLRVFRPNPLAEIDPNRRWVSPHLWQDPNGYLLSDRVWNASQATRRNINNLLTVALNNGAGALELSRLLEAYLIPGRAGIRTLRPYGRRFQPGGASADALRLARTEISRAHAQASYTAAYLNPYVGGGDWRLSAQHPKVDICDGMATIGKNGDRLRPAYDLRSCPLPPAHPNCLCTFVPVPTDSPDVVTQRLRAMMQDAQSDLLTAVVNVAVADELIRQLLGEGLFYLLRQAVQVPLL